MQNVAEQKGRKLQHSLNHRHLIWRAHPKDRFFKGMSPEVISTDGSMVRRLVCARDLLAFQTFEHKDTAQNIIENIEASVEPGVSLMGYSTFQDHTRLAILYTGEDYLPGWVCFGEGPRDELIPLPPNIDQVPRLRIIAGAKLSWSQRELVVQAALEQRGNSFAASVHAFDILEHVTSLELRAVSYEDGVQREVEIVKSPDPVHQLKLVGPTRLEASFALEPLVYREFRKQDRQVWFVITFDRELFCLPEEWCSFWFEVDVHEPPGVL